MLPIEPDDRNRVLSELAASHARIAPLFGRREVQRHSEQYLRGLLLSHRHRRNAETIAAATGGVPARALQRLLTSSPWPIEPVINALQWDLGCLLNAPDGRFVLGEIGFPKQGNASVGVARQSCGLSGAVINQQVGVFLAYVSSRGRALVDARLFLPPEWLDNPERRRRGGVSEQIVSRTRGELGVTMLRQARARGHLRGDWIATDMPSASDAAFRDALAAEGVSFVTAVGKGTHIFSAAKMSPLHQPAPHSPGSRKMQDLEAAVTAQGWHEIAVEEKPNLSARYQFAVRRVFESRDGQPGRLAWMVVRRDLAGGHPHYYLSNVPAHTPLSHLAQVATDCSAIAAIATDYDVVGLRDYEVRSWPGWHHHIALVLVAGAIRTRASVAKN